MTGEPKDLLLRAATGLEGGLVASGSTCGVVSGGCLGIAQFHRRVLRDGGPAAERRVMDRAAAYARWFSETYGTTLCRARVGCDFHTLSGQARYFLGPDRIARCVRHIRGAMDWLREEAFERPLPATAAGTAGCARPFHCAREVLVRVREKTGVGYPLLERLAVVFDGGVGYSGGACGALVGAILAINLILGLDIRRMAYLSTFGPFLRGHLNLLVEGPRGEGETFGVGKDILDSFSARAGGTECSAITGRRFTGWEDFQGYAAGSSMCGDLVGLAVELAGYESFLWGGIK